MHKLLKIGINYIKYIELVYSKLVKEKYGISAIASKFNWIIMKLQQNITMLII